VLWGCRVSHLSGSDFVRASADDDTNGAVIGGFMCVGRLYYQCRPQSQQFYATTTEGLVGMARDRKKQLIAENPLVYTVDAWYLRELQ